MAHARPKRDREREQRIEQEIIVDAYGPDERSMGWYCYLEAHFLFPFTATCIVKRAISPLRVKDEVDVIDMPGEDECSSEMFVTIRWDRKDGLAVPLSQLQPTRDTHEQTKQAIEDWHYWVKMGYEF